MTPHLTEQPHFTRIDRTQNDCWVWTGNKTRLVNGYGRVRVRMRQILAHRYFYELWCGPVQEGYELDHLCRNRLCVNPLHLEPVTKQVNVRRGLSIAGDNFRKATCVNGHPLTDDNLLQRKDSYRACKECKRLDSLRSRAALREAA